MRRGGRRRLPLDPDRETVAPLPRSDALEQAFGVFRRAQRPADALPPGRLPQATVDRARTRLLGQIGPTRFFAAPARLRGVPSVCLVAVRRGTASAAGCGPVSDAVKEAKPPTVTVGNVTAVFLRDDSTDLRFIYANGVGAAGARNNTTLVMSRAPLLGMSWTGGSGTRYVRYSGSPTSVPPPATCPKRLEPLPRDALAKARRAALIAVDRLYPHAVQATADAARPMRTPCSDAITARSIEVRLTLVPRDSGSVLLGMQDGFMRVFYLLR